MDITIIYGYGFETNVYGINDRSNKEGMMAVAKRYGFDYDRFLAEAGYLPNETPALRDFLDEMKANNIFETEALPLSYDTMGDTVYIYFKAGMPWDVAPNMPASCDEADRSIDEFLSLLLDQEYHGDYGEVANANYC